MRRPLFAGFLKEASSFRTHRGRDQRGTAPGNRHGHLPGLGGSGTDIFFVWHPHDPGMWEEGDDPAKREAVRRRKGVRAVFSDRSRGPGGGAVGFFLDSGETQPGTALTGRMVTPDATVR